MTKTIGIQGGPGSYHEAAALQLHPKAKLANYETFGDLFKALAAHQVDSAVVAIANTRVQFIQEPYDQLTGKDHKFFITAETYLRVEHCLLGLPGAKLADIQTVHSQAPALGQCLYYLENELSYAHPVEEHDTAGSAQLVAQAQDPTRAAIASKKAAELHGLDILAENIQDDPDNVTRFLELSLSSEASSDSGQNKTSILLRTPQLPGALLGALQPFKDEGINLTCLQSRLIPNTAFDMMFFVEFDAGLNDSRTRRVLQILAHSGYDVTVLGCYVSAPVPINEPLKLA